MAWDDQSGKKNPWDKNDSNKPKDSPKNPNDRRNPWGGPPGGGGGGNNSEPPDFDDMIRRAKANFESVMPGNMQSGGMIAIALLLLIALWIASGMYVINPGEQAVIQRFGAWSRTQSTPGLDYHLPAPIESVTKVNVEALRRMSIGFADRPSDNGRTGKQDILEESLMLTADRNIVDLDMVILWRIKSAEHFLFNIDDQENTIKKVAESAIREVVGQTLMFPLITRDRTEVADRTRQIIQANLDEYDSGIQIAQVLIDKAEVHPDVQSAFQDVQSAKQDAEDVKNRADEYRNKIIPEARGLAIQMGQEALGYKQSTIAKSKGDADRFNSIYEAYLGGKDVTKERIYLETMEDVLTNAQKIILGDKNGSGVVPYLPLPALDKSNSTASVLEPTDTDNNKDTP